MDKYTHINWSFQMIQNGFFILNGWNDEMIGYDKNQVKI